jgi:hypothetical protein
VPLLLCSLLSMLIAIIVPRTVDTELDAIVYLTDTDSFAYADFINQTDTYLDYYFFDVTNPTEVVLDGEAPALNQIGPFRYKSISVRYVTVFDSQEAPDNAQKQLSDVTFYEWNYVKNIVCRDGVAYPSMANFNSREPYPNSDSSWCRTGDTLDENEVFVTSVDLAYLGVLTQGAAGYMSSYPPVRAATSQIPVPAGPQQFWPALLQYQSASIGALVSLLVGYAFPAASYNNLDGRPELGVGPIPSTSLGLNPVFYSLDPQTNFSSVTNCEAFGPGAERDSCYASESQVCGSQGGFINLVPNGARAGDQYFECAPRGNGIGLTHPNQPYPTLPCLNPHKTSATPSSTLNWNSNSNPKPRP